MIRVMQYPADAGLYEAAKNYIQDIVAQQRSTTTHSIPLHSTQPPSRIAFLATLRRSHIELYANQDPLDIAAELCSYADKEGF